MLEKCDINIQISNLIFLHFHKKKHKINRKTTAYPKII